MRTLSFTLFFLFLFQSFAFATTWYVTTTGADTNSCSDAQNVETAKATINGALACVGFSAGQGADNTVLVRAGTYTSGNPIVGYSFPSGTSWNAPFKLYAYPGNCDWQDCEVVTIKPTAGNIGLQLAGDSMDHYGEIRGFVFDNSDGYLMTLFGGGSDGPNYMRLVGNRFVHSKASNSFSDYYGTHHNEIIRNSFEGDFTALDPFPTSGGNYSYPMYASGKNYRIEDNDFFNIPSYSIHWRCNENDHPGCQNGTAPIIARNKFHNGGLQAQTPGYGASFCAIYIGRLQNALIYDNLIYNFDSAVDNHADGICSDAYGDGFGVYNNTVYDITGSAYHVTSGSHTFTNDIAWSVGTAFNIETGSSTFGNNLCTNGTYCSITSDPLFVSSTDFRLQAKSPAIGQGANLSAIFTTDYASLSRQPSPTAWDIGAHRYVSASPASIGIVYNGMVRDRVGQGEASLSSDGAMDGVFTVTLNSGSGDRTVTQISLVRNDNSGTWDTIAGNIFWSLGAAAGFDSPLYNAADDSVNFALNEGSSFKVFGSDLLGAEFLPGSQFTITVNFSDGSQATATTTSDIPQNLIARIGFDEPSGTTANDVSGKNNNATWSAGVTRTTSNCKFGRCVSLDGTLNNMLIADSASLHVSSGFTVSAAIYPAESTISWRAMFTKGAAFWLFASSNDCAPGGVQGGFYNGTSNQTVCYSTPLTVPALTFLTLRFDGSNLSILENCSTVATSSTTGSVVADVNQLLIGNSPVNERFKGTLDHFFMYDYAIPDAQCTTDMNTAITNVPLPPTGFVLQ